MSTDDGGFKIVKVGQTAPLLKRVQAMTAPEGKVKHKSKHRTSQPKHGILKHGKTARKTPRFEGVADPAKAPPMKTKHKTLRIFTEKGLTLRRKRIADKVAKMPIEKVRETLRRNKLPIKDSTPSKVARQMLEDAQEAGMLSS